LRCPLAKRTFYYTDPAAALWMVRTFRLKLLAGTFCLQPESADAFLEMLGKGVRPERFVVAADSVSVLEPKHGDVVEEVAAGKTKVKRLAAKDFPLTGMTYDILQRTGKAFIMPEGGQ
jgi:hypothetical protein